LEEAREVPLGPRLLRDRSPGEVPNFHGINSEVDAWQEFRNNKNAKVNWQFTAKDARTKLKRLYPTLES
jgi:hypothetical protein